MKNSIKIDDHPDGFYFSVNGQQIEHITEYKVERLAGREALVTLTIVADDLDIVQSSTKEAPIV